MHLLAATPGAVDDGSEAIDLGQTTGDIVIVTAADTEIACFAAAQGKILDRDSKAPTVRCANFMHLGHNYAVDLYVEEIISKAKLVICRLLGGRSYWSYGVDEVSAACRAASIPVAFLPGDDKPDDELAAFSTVDPAAHLRLWRYLIEGGIDNAENALLYASELLGREVFWREPAALPKAGLYHAGKTSPNLADLNLDPGRPTAAIVFYRALVQAGNTSVIDEICRQLDAAGVNSLPVFVSSLKEAVSAAVMQEAFAEAGVDVILNGTGFAVSTPGAARTETPFDASDCPVLQIVFSGGNREIWEDGTKGLSARDIAMNVALPEIDGRILARAVSFKGAAMRDENVEADIVTYEPVADRCAFTAALAKAWADLRRTPAGDRRIGLVLANYPNRDGRLGNGVGLDTPAGALEVLTFLQDKGYGIEHDFCTGNDLIDYLSDGPTNAATDGRIVRETLALADYKTAFDMLPDPVRTAVESRWGAPQEDPFFLDDRNGFAVSAFACGNVAIGLQPARGYNIDPVQSYHNPALVPPHGYLAFYIWLRNAFGAQAVVHLGKHGNMEWLPGKAVGLSKDCFPEAVFGPMPHLYPFIVNDPGEGTQAKRRSSAVIIDHLTPPLTRAESYGPLKDLELLVDEYYEAAQGDPRRVKVLRREILDLTRSSGLDKDIGIDIGDRDDDNALAALDNHLCELKELQIRDGLHIFGRSPTDEQLTDLLIALVRLPRGDGKAGDASLLRALAQDLNLPQDFDPLDPEMAAKWTAARPDVLTGLSDAVWRSHGDTVERLELLSKAIVEKTVRPPGPESQAVFDAVETGVRPMVEACGYEELAALEAGLSGRFVAPGPSGAPTRGRLDVLPTGRNFYSVDTRTIPTPAAWTLGWKSAQLLVERYAQDHGEYPQRFGISAWGTSNMRTGGDDVAQALALMGARPTWDSASRRVTGFEILPLDVLDRPRVDVTFRISGFFRDAFPSLIDLVDSAARAVAALDEAPADNPMAERVRMESEALATEEGIDMETALHRSASRVYGSKPGAYGAGLQALIDEKGWQSDADLARAYVEWGAYAYGSGAEGRADKRGFESRLSTIQAVVHNQDNREHDLLDSDDYYQFEGGMTAAARVLSGQQPGIYHNDHSRPESPKIRTLQEEIGRVVRARVVNPKWIAGVMRHGYKGAFEMAATVDYLFAFSATTGAVGDHHFDLVFDAYLGDDEVRAFLADNNPAALREMADKLREALDRGLWQPKRNSLADDLRELLEQ
ncbi:MAG: cobaltochelatase subunit CobN [Alphaproteobacteria bacterium]